ncbi:MAG: PTS ascorbate transporter subunit IIC [Streptosporangiales bacterium]|nr:PTS ascorbate transporter subunit IIC [Streptosporangiales bacterium]
MDVLRDIAVWVANNVFGQVPILIGLITLAGLLLQRKPLDAVVGGAMRATLGIVILFIGVEIFVGGLTSFQKIVSSAVGLQAPASQNTLGEFLGTHGGTAALVITIGFLIHVALVRIFPAARYIYLTGHLMFWISVVITATLVETFDGISNTALVVCGSVLIACYWTLQPLWMRPLMLKVTGKDDFGFGHTTSVLALLSGYLARPLGDPERHDTEKLRIPRQLSFFKDINVSTVLVIGLIMLIAMAFADDAVVAAEARAFNADIDPWVWGIIAALRFAAGIAILLYGVRMFLAEIVPAFKGISDKAVPGSRPALDIPAVFPFAPTAVMVGFVASTVTFLALMGVFAAAGWFTLVPPMIMLFFGGGAGGVFGNVVAGWRGAVLGGVLNGIILAFGQWATWGLLGDTAPELATLADPDWYAIAWLMTGVGAVVRTPWVLAGLVAVVTVAVLLLLTRRRAAAGAAPRAGARTGGGE